MNNLKVLRMQQGITQKEMASRLGVHLVTYGRVEGGWFTRPPADLEEKLRKELGVEWTFAELMKPAPIPRPSKSKLAK